MIRYDMPEKEYHAHPAVSNSRLNLLAISAAHMKAKVWKDTPAKREGSAYHKQILEPLEFLKTYRVAPKIDRRSNDGKAEYAYLMAEVEEKGQILIFQDFMDRMKAMKEVMQATTTASGLLTGGKYEVSVFWTDEETGLDCKCRIDCIKEDLRAITDLKKVADASWTGFQKAIGNYHHERQAGFYLEGLSQATGETWDTWNWVAQEAEAPFGIATYMPEAEDIQAGLQEARELLRIYKDCKEKNKWPGYPDRIQTITRPNWAKNRKGVIYE